MKHKLLSIALLLSSLLTISCSDFLNVVPEGTPNQNAYFQTDKDAEGAMNAVYWCFGLGDGLWGRDLFWEQGCSDDITYTRSRWLTLETLAFTGDESPLVNAWNNFYKYIASSQWVIESLLHKQQSKELTPIERRTLGEAYFMRAYLHFHIAYRYGRIDQGVPFERWEDFSPKYNNEVVKQQPSVVDNYELIISDLEKAEELLPLFQSYAASDLGRAHRAAAWALKVKVWAYWAYHDSSKWNLIPSVVDQLEAEGQRDLLANVEDVFKMENNYSKEYIWSVTSKGGATPAGSEFSGICLMNKGWGFYNGWGSVKATYDLYEEFDANDKRRKLTLYTFGDTFTYFGDDNHPFTENGDAVQSGFMIAKYIDPWRYGNKIYKEDGSADQGATALTNPYISVNGDWPTSDLHIPLIRHAEMVLFKAEALIQQGNGVAAATELNRLTSRAGLGNVYTHATMDDLMHERRCELAGEFYDRFMDLKRWKQTDLLTKKLRGRVGIDPSNPATECIINEIWPVGDAVKSYDPSVQLVFPYPSQELIKAGGKWKQNTGY